MTDWKKSSFSAANGHCVEVLKNAIGRHVRNSKDPGGAFITFSEEDWDAFVKGVKAGEFD